MTAKTKKEFQDENRKLKEELKNSNLKNEELSDKYKSLETKFISEREKRQEPLRC